MTNSTSPYYPVNSSGKAPVIVQGVEIKSHLQPVHVYNHGSATASTSLVGGVRDTKAEAPARGCRDFFWALLFYAHLGGMAYLTATYAPQMALELASEMDSSSSSSSGSEGERYLGEDADYDDANNIYSETSSNTGNSTLVSVDPQAVAVVVGLSGALGFLISSFALGFMITCAQPLVKMALWFNIIMYGVLAVLSFLAGVPVMGLIFFVMSAVSAYYAYSVWSRIPFAASNLATAVTAVRDNMGLAFYAYLSVLILFGWSVWWAMGTTSFVYVTSGCSAADGVCQSQPNGLVIFLLLLSFYWTAQVISNVVHVTTAGVVGTWWFAPHEARGCCSSAVRSSYVRSLTYSFGSICLGSLIVALIQAVKETIHSARENGDSFLACFAECLIGCIESLVEYFNKWAFVYVGLYGFSFMEAGSNVMTLFRSRGWTSIITDVMVDTVLFMVSLGVGVLTTLLAVAAAAVMVGGDTNSLSLAAVIGLIVGYGMCATLFSVVSSAVNTCIVCYAEAPNEFQANHPELSARMRLAWRQAWPNEFSY